MYCLESGGLTIQNEGKKEEREVDGITKRDHAKIGDSAFRRSLAVFYLLSSRHSDR